MKNKNSAINLLDDIIYRNVYVFSQIKLVARTSRYSLISSNICSVYISETYCWYVFQNSWLRQWVSVITHSFADSSKTQYRKDFNRSHTGLSFYFFTLGVRPLVSGHYHWYRQNTCHCQCDFSVSEPHPLHGVEFLNLSLRTYVN